MAKDYIEECNGGYYVKGTRVSLDSVARPGVLIVPQEAATGLVIESLVTSRRCRGGSLRTECPSAQLQKPARSGRGQQILQLKLACRAEHQVLLQRIGAFLIEQSRPIVDQRPVGHVTP